MSVYNIIHTLVYKFIGYRIHLTILYFFLLYFNNYRLESTIDYHLMFSFGLWHFALFLFDRVYDRKIDALSQPDEYIKDGESKILYAVVILLLTSSLALYLQTDYPIIYWLYLLPVTFLYPLKIYKNWRFKKVLLIKNLYSALLIYCIPLMIQAYLISDGNNQLHELFLPHLSLFIYVMIGEVFWDIRDASADKSFGTRTIPNVMGLTFTRIYILTLILIDAFVTKTYFSTSAYIYIVLILFVNENSKKIIFHIPPLAALLRFKL